MTGDLDIRPYEPGDEAAILELFHLAFGRPMSLAAWEWRFRDNPTDRIMIDLAWSGDVLAGHYAVSPAIVCIDGQELLTGHSMTTMTHPDYRGRGVFGTLAESLYSRMASEDMVMVSGFPNDFSHRGFVNDLAWVDIHEVPTFRKVLAEGKPIPEPSAHVMFLESFDSRSDQLWADVKGTYYIATKRDSRYLRWRYETNPDNDYSVLGYVQDGRLNGYAVCKRYLSAVDLVDILSVDDTVGLDLVYGVAKWALHKKAESVNIWLNSALPLHRELESLGFCNGEPVTYFGGRWLGESATGSKIQNFRNWYLTMGDSDLY